MTSNDSAGARPEAPRIIVVAQALPGRSRFRLSWLHPGPGRRPDADDVNRLADQLAAIPGMIDVEIRAFTGSVLCSYDPQRVDPDTLLAHLERLTGAAVQPSGTAPLAPAVVRAGPGVVARDVARLFKEIDDKVLLATDGRIDLGTLTTFGFLGAGFAGVAASGHVSAPPWFNLAWWGIRTFMTMESDAIADSAADEEGS